MVRAILLVEFAEAAGDAAKRLESVSLGNCLQLVWHLPGGEAIVHVECNDSESLNEAITHDFAAIEGVSRITTCAVLKR